MHEYSNTRIKLPQSWRNTIAYKQKWTCNICKALLPPRFELDHIIPLHRKGTNAITNLQALCPNCHSYKSHCEQLDRCQKEGTQRYCLNCFNVYSTYFNHICPTT